MGKNVALKPCDCGKTPDKLHIARNGAKYAFVSGDCCGDWTLEFETDYYSVGSSKCMELAIQCWNEASCLTDDSAS